MTDEFSVAHPCADCGISTSSTGNIFKVTDDLWQRVAVANRKVPAAYLCLNCVEIILERKLMPGDFSEDMVNFSYRFPRNALLIERMGARFEELRARYVESENALPIMWYWLSFADEEKGFLGVAIVRARSIDEAITRAWELGINPGGEVQSSKFEQAPEFEAYENQLLDKTQLEDAGL